MTRKQRIELINALVDFCVRVAKGPMNTVSDAEVEVLPEVAKILLDLPVTRPDTTDTKSKSIFDLDI